MMITWLEGKIVERKRWCDDLYSIKIKTEPLSFIAGQFVIVGLDHDNEKIQKPYSLVNAPSDEFLEIHLNTVQGGKFSPLLTKLVEGDTVYISNRPSGLLTLNEVPEEVSDLWFLATGTGIGPFISILNTEEPWQRFEKIIVCYSVKAAEEMAYHGDFEALLKRYPNQFHFVPFITRESKPDAIHSRITTFLGTGELEKQLGITLTPESSHVMLCGNSAMIVEATALLQQKGLRLHNRREAGHISTEKYF
jgi:ferredoxin--NADP+ reductase